MQILVAAIGRMKRGPETDLADRYSARATAAGRSLGLGPLAIKDYPESKLATVEQRRAEEADRLTRATPDAGARVALDETGRQLTSRELAQWIAARRDAGTPSLTFVIGGPDGLDRPLLTGADLALSLGRITLPHQLARVVLIEQLYRVTTILSGHPYHRD